MGDYTAVAVRLKVKKSTPACVLNFIDALWSDDCANVYKAYEALQRLGQANEIVTAVSSYKNSLDELCSLAYGVSAYFPGWRVTIKEDFDEHHWLYEVASSTKYPNSLSNVAVLQALLPYCSHTQGDILYRTLFECSEIEDVWAVDNTGKLHNYTGLNYGFTDEYDYQGFGSDDLERIRTRADDNRAFIAPWTMNEIIVLDADNKSIIAEKNNNGWW